MVESLAALKRQIAQKLLVIWDGPAIHRSRIVRAWLDQRGGRVHIAALPPYAPELNPVETIWGYLKKHEIAKFCARDIAQVSDFARWRLKSMPRRLALVRAFWKQTGLTI